MQIIGAIVSFILILASMVGLFWTMVGIPAGGVLFILKANKKVNLTQKKILLIMFGGLGLLIGSFVLFFLLSVILGFLGISLTNLTLPEIPEK